MACHEAELDAAVGDNVPFGHLFESTIETPLDSIYQAEVSPIAWFSMNIRQYGFANPGIDNGDGITSCRFIPVTGFDYMMYSYLRARLPALAVKQEYSDRYRIAWCPNVMHEITNNAECMVNDNLILQHFDTHWLIFEGETSMAPGFGANYDRGVGNVPELLTFATALPNYKIWAHQPWFYASRSEQGFPLFLLNSQTVIYHDYRFLLRISSLLRMQELGKDGWYDIIPDLSVLTGIPDNGMLQSPQLWGVFGKIRDNERDNIRCNGAGNGYRYVTHINNVISCDDNNTAKCGKTVTVKLSCDGPCKAIFWAAHNKTAERYNYRSNYTTATSELSKGSSAISYNSLLYGNNHKFKNLENDHFNGPLTNKHLARASRVKGLNVFCFAYRPTAFGIEVGVDLSAVSASLSVSLADPEYNKWKNGNVDVRGRGITTQSCDDDFKLIVRMLKYRELYIDSDGHIGFTF